MAKKYLFFVVGATNVGKSTFLSAIRSALGKQVHLVEVGKWMRAKYPPEHFKGQAAPAHTQKEALEMLFGGIEKGREDGATIILVDGQPRDVEQSQTIKAKFRDEMELNLGVLHLVCPREERERRARARDLSPEAIQLSLDRMDRDILQLHEVLIDFDWWEKHQINTHAKGYSPYTSFERIIQYYGL